MVETAISTGVRWGELIALKPRHLDLAAGRLTVEETIVEVSDGRTPPPGSGCSPSPTPRTTNPAPWTPARPRRTAHRLDQPATARAGRLVVRDPRWHPDLAEHLPHPRLAARRQGVRGRLRRPRSRPASCARQLALAGGSDLTSVMDRMGHSQITTTQKYLHPCPTPTPRTSPPSSASGNPEQPGEAKPGAGEPGAGSTTSRPASLTSSSSAPGATNGHAWSRDDHDPLAIPVRESGCRTATICSGLNLFEAAIRNSHWSSHLWMDSHKIWTEDGAVQGHTRGPTQIAIESSLPNMTSRRSAEHRRPRADGTGTARGPRGPRLL